MTAVEPQVSVSGPQVGSATARDVVAAYVGLMKPRVIELLLLTTVPVMFYAQRGVPPLGLVVAVTSTISRESAQRGQALKLARGPVFQAAQKRLAMEDGEMNRFTDAPGDMDAPKR